MSNKTWGIIFLVVAAGILIFIAYYNGTKRGQTIVFSPYEELQSLWQSYKINFLEQGTYRVLDKQRNYITTSEGEGYAMLRSVWMDDKTTFDESWTWTKNNLQRKNDHLISWLFGQQSNGTYGILTNQGGANTASDADTDIALSLLFASARWNQASYYGDAEVLIQSIWNNEVVMIGGKPYMTADNLEKDSASGFVLSNPSYLSPATYRIFALVDSAHPWLQVVDTSYAVLQQSMSLPLDKKTSANIPPDWVMINKKTGQVEAAVGTNPALDTDMSYDALRVPFRIALDWQWNHDPRAQQLLDDMSFLDSQWKTNSLLYTDYTHDGIASSTIQSASFYGGTIGYFMIADPTTAQQVYTAKLQSLFDPDTNSWKVNLSYYDDNWAWFGIALYNNLLPKLVSSAPTLSSSVD